MPRTGSEPLGQIALDCGHSSHSPSGPSSWTCLSEGSPEASPVPSSSFGPLRASHPRAWPHAHVPGRPSRSSLSLWWGPPGLAAWDCCHCSTGSRWQQRQGLAASRLPFCSPAEGLSVVFSSSRARLQGVASFTPRFNWLWITAGPVGYLKPRVIFVLQTGPPVGQI